MSKVKAAPLDLILKANGQPTGDELRAQQVAEREARTAAEKAASPVFLNARQRRNIRKLIEKANEAAA